ncbi:MAG: hypothetical protein M1831_007453 [Alyxoria varia]|nr:MAG: hypothetical protein M1831_007453 [Alyxoria varia]
MLEELQRALPRYGKYETELPMTKALEQALSKAYYKLIILCARTITFFRNNPLVQRNRTPWLDFHNNFRQTIQNLKTCARLVDEEADIIRMERENTSAEAVTAMRNVEISGKPAGNSPCHVIPYGLNPRFHGRSREVMRLKALLDEPNNSSLLTVVAIHGLAGVGKTQTALHYAHASLKHFDVIAWIPAETQIKMTQALSSLANKLGIDDSNWLNETKYRYLLVFDNVERIDLLLQAWPSNANGAIIITTVSPVVASKRANHIELDSFTADTAVDALYALTGTTPASADEMSAAEDICKDLGGLPLALDQISDFIRNRGSSYREFLNLYRKSAGKIHARGKPSPEYNHTLSTCWQLHLERLPDEARLLERLFVFFDPDAISEDILTNPNGGLSDERWGFLLDDFDFGDAVGSLIQAHLVNRSSSQKTLSLHRLVQNVVLLQLCDDDKIFHADTAVILLSNAFPNTWTLSGPQQGHGWESWETCAKVLPHVSRLILLVKEKKVMASNNVLFAELIFRYLWQREQPILGQSFFEFGLSFGLNRESELCNPAVRMVGHCALDKAQPCAAVTAYNECLQSRIKLRGADSPAVADVLDSVACSHTELGETDESFALLERAFAIHEANGTRGARTTFVHAMNCLRAGKPDDALASLQRCWELQGLTKEQVAQSRYPKHSGQPLKRTRSASRTVVIRKQILGARGPRVADSMFHVARLLREERKEALAAKMLREIVEMGQGLQEMGGQLSRAHWMLGRMEEDTFGDEEGAREERRKAKEVRRGILQREVGDEETDEAFEALVPWLLP